MKTSGKHLLKKKNKHNAKSQSHTNNPLKRLSAWFCVNQRTRDCAIVLKTALFCYISEGIALFFTPSLILLVLLLFYVLFILLSWKNRNLLDIAVGVLLWIRHIWVLPVNSTWASQTGWLGRCSSSALLFYCLEVLFGNGCLTASRVEQQFFSRRKKTLI